MSIAKEILQRSGEKCELCGSTELLVSYTVESGQSDRPNEEIVACSNCQQQMDNPESMDPNHWRCLNDSMWSEAPAVQVQAWRMLSSLKSEGWPQDLLDMMYMDEDMAAWASATGEGVEKDDSEKYIDSNGNELQNGDNVVLIQTLNVSGANVNAAKGVVVKNVRLVPGANTHIEGRIDNQMIQILTKYLRKTK